MGAFGDTQAARDRRVEVPIKTNSHIRERPEDRKASASVRWWLALPCRRSESAMW